MLVDSNAWYDIDLTRVEIIKGLVKELHGNGIAVHFTKGETS